MFQSSARIGMRLRESRIRLGMTQEEMAALLGVSQGHYSKLEDGTNAIKYVYLKKLKALGVDICYLITGEPAIEGVFDAYANRLSGTDGRRKMVGCFLSVIELGTGPEEEEGFPEALRKNLRFLRITDGRPENLWRFLRWLNGMTQSEMAEILGMNLKRYQRLESGKIMPDSEILFRLYTELGYSPLIGMDDGEYGVQICNQAGSYLSAEYREQIPVMLDYTLEVISRSER